MSAVPYPDPDRAPFRRPTGLERALPVGLPVPLEHPVPSEKRRPVRMRASDADRQVTIRALQDALARGQLTFEEAGERMSAAWSTRYAADLSHLTEDLPPVAEETAAPGWATVWQLFVRQVRVTLARAFPGGLRSPLARLAMASAVLVVLGFLVLAGAAAHALIGDGPDFDGFHHPGGPGFGVRGGFPGGGDGFGGP